MRWKIGLTASAALALCLATPAAGEQASLAAASPPDRLWLDANLPPDERARAALAAMTLDEKLRLVFGYSDQALTELAKVPDDIVSPELKHYVAEHLVKGSAGFVPGVPRLGIPDQTQTDASIGVRNSFIPSTALPSSLATAASFDTEVPRAGGRMIGGEARATRPCSSGIGRRNAHAAAAASNAVLNITSLLGEPTGRVVAAARLAFSYGQGSLPGSAGLVPDPSPGAATSPVFEEVAWLALERCADRIEGREADSLDLAGFQQGQVGERDSDRFGKVGHRHFPLREHDVDIDDDGHQTIASLSSRSADPARNASEKMRISSPAARRPNPRLASTRALVAPATPWEMDGRIH